LHPRFTVVAERDVGDLAHGRARHVHVVPLDQLRGVLEFRGDLVAASRSEEQQVEDDHDRDAERRPRRAAAKPLSPLLSGGEIPHS
jgi:hypothetical protein